MAELECEAEEFRARTHVRLSAFTALTAKDQIWSSGQPVRLGAAGNRCGNRRGRMRR